MACPTVKPGQAQPAQGAVDTFGERYDILYMTDTSWRARRDSLLGEGTVLSGATHYFSVTLNEGTIVNQAGQHQFTHTRCVFVFIAGMIGGFAQELQLAAPFFSLKPAPLCAIPTRP